VKDALIAFDKDAQAGTDAEFLKRYHALLRGLQHDLGDMHPATITMSANQVADANNGARGNIEGRAAIIGKCQRQRLCIDNSVADQKRLNPGRRNRLCG